MALTQESLLSFLLDRGGSVKNSELLNNFRTQIGGSDASDTQRNRELFKRLVNSVAVVKQVGDVKFVVVKKRYQDFAHDASPDTTRTDDSLSSFSYTPPHRAQSARTPYSDIDDNNNNNMRFPSTTNGNCCRDATTVKVLTIPGDQASRAGTSGAVFAVIALKPPQRDPAPGARRARAHPRAHPDWTSDKGAPPPVLMSPIFPACKKESPGDNPRLTEDVNPAGAPLVRPPSRREDAKDSESVPLEPLAHEWLVKCAAGLWGQIHGLLLQDTRLAQKRDFMSGFTALHWAAKNGNGDMIHQLVDVSRKRGTCVNVNSKAHGGYTPLHVAAMHGHSDVMVLLVHSYGANVNERDNDGKKALHYLGPGVSDEVRALLGGLQQSRYGEKTEDDEYREHSKGFNSISKLFQPHKKQKTTTKCAHDG